MKKLLFFSACLLIMVACKNDEKPIAVVEEKNVEQNDSLMKIIEQKDNEINDLFATFNLIQEGLNQIAEAENYVSMAKEGDSTEKMKQISDKMQFIQQKMKENRDLLDKMREQLRQSSLKGDELKKTIESLISQIEEKDAKLQQLRSELDAKDIHITEQEQKITDLNNNVTDLKIDSTSKSRTIDEQDKKLHTAYFVFGTKEELKKQNILNKKEVLKSDFNKNYFTKIDIRVEKEFKLFSKSAKLLTSHPAGSYTLSPDASGQQVLRVTNADKFWSTSKYMVILVK